MDPGSNFDFLPAAWPDLRDAAQTAEAQTPSDPVAAAAAARRALAQARTIQEREAAADSPRIVQQWQHVIASSEPSAPDAAPPDADMLLETLHKVLWWLAAQHDEALGPRTPIDWIQVERRAAYAARTSAVTPADPPSDSSSDTTDDTADDRSVADDRSTSDAPPSDAPAFDLPVGDAPEPLPDDAFDIDADDDLLNTASPAFDDPLGGVPEDNAPETAVPDVDALDDLPDDPPPLFESPETALPEAVPSESEAEDPTPDLHTADAAAWIRALRAADTSAADVRTSAACLLHHIADRNHALLRSFDARRRRD